MPSEEEFDEVNLNGKEWSKQKLHPRIFPFHLLSSSISRVKVVISQPKTRRYEEWNKIIYRSHSAVVLLGGEKPSCG